MLKIKLSEFSCIQVTYAPRLTILCSFHSGLASTNIFIFPIKTLLFHSYLVVSFGTLQAQPADWTKDWRKPLPQPSDTV